MLRRDVDRFAAAASAAAAMPLGSGALAGLNWDLDRGAVAAELGFDRVVENSIDGVSNRDFALDYLSAAAVCATHLSRIGAEIVLWSTSEFGFCRPAEEFSSGSSIMPQKMNPDAAELLRAKAPRVVAALTTLTGVMHGLPLAYSKDLQEDKEPLFDAADTIELCLRALDGMLPGIEFDHERMAAAAADEMAAATDVADLLVRRGLPFRRGPRSRRRAGSPRPRGRYPALGDPARGARRVLRAPRRRVLRGARRGVLARLEGLARRHLRGGRREAAGAGEGEPRRARLMGAAAGELDRDFFDRAPRDVAADLIGCTLLHGGIGGVIVETEAYERDDPACHAFGGPTARNAPLFGPPGRAYVYLCYGIHSMFNLVAEPEGVAAAVLVRALEPTAGVEAMRERRRLDSARELCSGPGKLCQALGIELSQSGMDALREPFTLLAADARPDRKIVAGPRIGITKAADYPWRYCLADSPFLSRPVG